LLTLIKEAVLVGHSDDYMVRLSLELPSSQIDLEASSWKNQEIDLEKYKSLLPKVIGLDLTGYSRQDQRDEGGSTNESVPGGSRSVSLACRNSHSEVRVSGYDESWVVGTFERLRSLFRERNPGYRLVRKLFTCLPYIFLVLAFGSLSLLGVHPSIKGLVSFLLLLLFFGVSFVALLQNRFVPQAKFVGDAQANFSRYEKIILMVLVLTLIATVVSILK